MGYIENNLVPGERVEFKTSLHWWVVIRMLINAVVFGLLFGFLLNVILSSRTGLVTVRSGDSLSQIPPISFVTAALICIVPLVILSFVVGALTYLSAEFGLTNRRVLIKTGILRRRTLELNLSKVEGFQVRESIMGRLLGFKHLMLTGSGGTRQTFYFVANADEFRRAVINLSTRDNDQNADAHPPRQRELPTETAISVDAALQRIQVGDRHGAQQIVRQLVRLYPRDADVWYLVGFLSEGSQRKRDAYAKALSLNPQHQKAHEALRRLR